MNVFLRTHLILLALLLASHVRLPGQGILKDTLEVFQDGRGEYYFEALNSPNGITSQARHGKVWVASVLPGSGINKIYKLIYEPSAGYVGLDTFRYNRLTCYNSPACYEQWEVLVRVKTSEVYAEPDLFYIPANSEEVALDVLRNDSGSSGHLNLLSIGTVNNGEASIEAGNSDVFFKPRPGFTGVAQLIYTVCDPLGTCDQASVSIVVGQVQGPGEDTLRIFTLRDAPVDVTVPDVYVLLEEPSNGAFNRESEIPVYLPSLGFVGSDYLTFAGQQDELVVEIIVLDVTRNKFALDDQASLTPGKKTEISVLSNDGYGTQAGCFSFGQPMYGKVKGVDGYPGLLTYEAPAGFVGVDEFTYTSSPPGCTGSPETATVRVFVSNFEPVYSKFRMNTPMNTPLVITYSIPITDFHFNVSQKARSGELLYLSGMVDTVVLGTRIRGYNILVYIPHFGAIGKDEFEVSYCLSGSGTKGCRSQKNVKIEMDILPIGDGEPQCFSDCIWAGDTNFDGIVNMEDLLPLGRFMGEVGRPRLEANLDLWYGQYGESWENPYAANDMDLKHIDTNGDSLITAFDTLAISRFYGRTHSLVPVQLPYSDYEIRMEGDVFVEPGQEVELDLYIGDKDNPVTDLYGFTFDLSYNPLFFQPEFSKIEFLENSWLTYNSPVLSMTRNDGSGRVDAGFTRTNDQPAVGYGKIGRSKVVVTVDIIGVTPPDADGNIQIPVTGGSATAVNSSGQRFSVRVAPFNLIIRTKVDAPETLPGEEQPLEKMLLLFPNPASETAQVYLPGQIPMERVQVFSYTGQLVFDSGALSAQQFAVPVKDFVPGIYFMRVLAGSEVISRKLEVHH